LDTNLLLFETYKVKKNLAGQNNNLAGQNNNLAGP